MKLSIKVIPSSSRDCIAGWLGDTLRIKVTAPPEKGKANHAVRKVMAKALDLPAGSVQIINGETSARKTLELNSISESELYRKLSVLYD